MAKETLAQGEIEALLNELEAKMARLRTIYEQYFLGIERMPPLTLRKDVFRIVQGFENIYIRNTAQKFRLRSLVQRFNSYKSYWGRIERQIEEGTYVRDVNRARRNQERHRQRSETDDDAIPMIELDFEIDAVDDIQVELEEMERAGAFDTVGRRRSPNEPRMPDDPQTAVQFSNARETISDEERERRRQQRLEELRQQLSGGDAPSSSPSSLAPNPAASSDGDRQAKLERLKNRLNREPAPSHSDIRGADMEQIRKIAAMKAKIEAERQAAASSDNARPRTIQRTTGPQRVVQRPTVNAGDDDARKVYDKLIATKRQLNESTQGLSYEQVRSSMQAQRDQIRQSRGASDVEFQVVVKDGRAFLKPVPK